MKTIEEIMDLYPRLTDRGFNQKIDDANYDSDREALRSNQDQLSIQQW
jgi:hypothetical protein